MSRRGQIAMSDEEVQAFLADQKTVVCATNGVRGFPHLMPLWYVMRDGEIWAWTYGKSQKILNVERDPRATLQVEAGEEYAELRGVMIEAEVVLHRDLDFVTDFGMELFERYTPGLAAAGGDAARAALAVQAAKRVAMQFVPHRVASWDHRKLGGVY